MSENTRNGRNIFYAKKGKRKIFFIRLNKEKQKMNNTIIK